LPLKTALCLPNGSRLNHNLEKYTLEELYDVEDSIDKLKYSERYKEILTLIVEKEKLLHSSHDYIMATKNLKENEEIAERKYTALYVFIRVLLWAPFFSLMLTYELETYERVIAFILFFSFLKLCKNICVAFEISHLDKFVKEIANSKLGKK
jgi:hypothetical protein